MYVMKKHLKNNNMNNNEGEKESKKIINHLVMGKTCAGQQIVAGIDERKREGRKLQEKEENSFQLVYRISAKNKEKASAVSKNQGLRQHLHHFHLHTRIKSEYESG